ncbi:hypothetical protein NDU88_000130 [Pleurodeles waltl]|uniref:Uncharacterized protein n=1 Tax=Pleurodeles waltl TaxID=8319 RepID=A0AAV7VVY1_PLEWA|nr:hypothetical protein NDU88_000130 [Pleurodeles waltl]
MATSFERLLEPVGKNIDKQMKHSGDTLVDDISDDIAAVKKKASPSVNQQKSTGHQENMETGDYSQSSEQVPGPEETHKGHPVQHSGDSDLASNYPNDMPGAEKRPSPKLLKQKSTGNQENEEYSNSNQKKDYRSEAKGIYVHQHMQHSQVSIASSELSDYTDDDVRRPSTKFLKQKLNSHQEDKEPGDYIHKRDRYSPDEPSSRILQLATPKEDKREWATSFTKIVWGNQDPIWPQSFSALSTTQSKRILSLAKPKKVFQPQSQRFSVLCGWRSASEKVSFMDLPSDRILRLAEPKKRLETPAEQRHNVAALMYKASDRILQLARPRPVHSDYRADRETSARRGLRPVESLVVIEAQVLICMSAACLLLGQYAERPPPDRPLLPRAPGHSRASGAPSPSKRGSRGAATSDENLTRRPMKIQARSGRHQRVGRSAVADQPRPVPLPRDAAKGGCPPPVLFAGSELLQHGLRASRGSVFRRLSQEAASGFNR